MKRALTIFAMLAALVLVLNGMALAEMEVPKSKQTTLGLYVTAKEAFTQWHTAQDKIKIIDVRTPEEYVFVGHAPMAVNIPSMFMSYNFDAEKKHFKMEENKDFVALVQKQFKPEDTLYLMCRSGGRSAQAVNKLAAAGFKNAYNIVDGFEGDAIKDEGSYNKGMRLLNGWRNSGAPWTYGLQQELVYQPAK